MLRRAITYAELKRHIPYTRRWLLELERQGRFPRRHSFEGSNRVYWWEDEIVEYLRRNSGPADDVNYGMGVGKKKAKARLSFA